MVDHCQPDGGSFAFHHKNDCMACCKRSARSRFFKPFASPLPFSPFFAVLLEEEATASGSRLRFFVEPLLAAGSGLALALILIFFLLTATRGSSSEDSMVDEDRGDWDVHQRSNENGTKVETKLLRRHPGATASQNLATPTLQPLRPSYDLASCG
jgi:hypothetical protein